MPLMAEGEFALVTERLDRSLTLSGQPVKRGTMAHEHIVYMMMVDSMAVSEDGAGIAAHAPRLVELTERDDHQPYLAVAWRALGVAGRLKGEFSEAERLLRSALAVFEERGMVWQIGRTLFELGKLACASGERAEAAAWFDRAQAAFAQQGATPFVEFVQAQVEALIG